MVFKPTERANYHEPPICPRHSHESPATDRRRERESIIRETTDHPTQNNVPNTTFFSHVANTFFGGDEDQLFRQFNINRTVFDAAFNLVSSIPLPRRGRRSFVQTHRDKLLFLFLFLTNGTKVLSRVCLPRLNCQSAILHHLHEAATLFIQPLLKNTVLFSMNASKTFLMSPRLSTARSSR